MNFLMWLENTGFAEWIRVSTVGYPLMITLHSIGLAIMVGLSVALDMRLLGWFKGVPYTSLYKLLGVAWIGFIINFISGAALFTSQAASNYAHNTQFWLKMAFVVLGAILVGWTQVVIKRDAQGWTAALAPAGVRGLAWATIAAWAAATITGRLIAYLA
jgi:hypothetical protein